MASNDRLILAAINGGGAAGNSLAYFAPQGTAGPTDGTTALVAAYKDAGWCSEKGLSGKVAESSKDIPAFGTFSPVRTIVTSSKQTFDVEFLESNLVSLAVYHRKSLTALTSAPTTGAVNFGTGPAAEVHYSAVFEMVDGVNRLRAYCPNVTVTDRGDLAVKGGEVVSYPVTLTAFPGADGDSVKWFYILDALKTA